MGGEGGGGVSKGRRYLELFTANKQYEGECVYFQRKQLSFFASFFSRDQLLMEIIFASLGARSFKILLLRVDHCQEYIIQ